MKDASRVQNVYLLLRDVNLVSNPEQLIKFIEDTVGEYKKLPNKGDYVKGAIDEENVLRGVERLRTFIDEFYDTLTNKLNSGRLDNIEPLPDFKVFSDKLGKSKMEAYKLYKDYLANPNDVIKLDIKNKLDEIQKKCDDVNKNISKVEEFTYYYEVQTTFDFITDIKNHL